MRLKNLAGLQEVGDFDGNKVGGFVDTLGNLVDNPVCYTVEESCGNKIRDPKYLECSRVLSLGSVGKVNGQDLY